VDFADVRAVMTNMGMALMGIGFGRGDRRALDAAHAAISSPLLDNMSVQGATGILINFTGGPDMRLSEINDAATMIMDSAHEDANIIFGSVINPDMRDAIKVTVIATGFGRHTEAFAEPKVAAVRQPASAMPLVQPVRQRPAPPPEAMQYAAPVTNQRTTIPDLPRRREAFSQPPPVPRERDRGERFSFNPNDAELDIPTFLRNRGE
jgi:cell division protein FtsZ